MKFLVPRAIAVGIALLMTLAWAGSASAHEHRTVGEYELVVGFVNEPAIQGDTNGVSLEVTKADAPVEGLADTLKVTVIFGDQSREFALSPAWNEPGKYYATFIPTEPGDYTFQFTGTIEGVEVDETFTSSPEGFDSVAARSDLEFPVPASGSSTDSSNSVAMPIAAGAIILAGGVAMLIRRSVTR